MSKNPWKTTNVPAPVSLKSTFPVEKEATSSKPAATARQTYVEIHIQQTIIYLSNKYSRSVQNPTRSIPITQPSPPQHDVTNPWSITATSPPTNAYSLLSMTSTSLAPPMSFKHIQDQETRAHEALRQISNKSLEKIQVSHCSSFRGKTFSFPSLSRLKN